MAGKKNQHYIQQRYLQEFKIKKDIPQLVNDPAVYILNKHTGAITVKAIKNTASENYYYSFRDKTGKMNPAVENYFSSFENYMGKFIKEIKSACYECNQGNEPKDIHPKYREFISLYLYMNLIRVPEIYNKLIISAEEFSKQKYGEEITDEDRNYIKFLSLRTLITIGTGEEENIAAHIFDKNLYTDFFQRSKAHIVTCDNPVCRFNLTKKNGLAVEGTHVVFPLSEWIILDFYNIGNKIILRKRHDLSHVKVYNDLIFLSATDEIYSGSLSSLIEICKTYNIEYNCDLPDFLAT